MAAFMTFVGVLLIALGVIFNLYLILGGLIFIFLGWVARRIPQPPSDSDTDSSSDPNPTSGCGVCLIALLIVVLLFFVFSSFKA